MNWMLLIFAGCLEALWAVSLRYTEGYTKLGPSIISSLLAIVTIYVVSKAFQHFSYAVAYPIWVGLGVIGTTALSHFLFKDAVSLTQIIFVGMIFLGIVGLKVSTL